MNVVPSVMPSKEPMLHIVMGQDLLDWIDDYRYANRIPTRSEAVRQLVIRSLEQSEVERRRAPAASAEG